MGLQWGNKLYYSIKKFLIYPNAVSNSGIALNKSATNP